MGNSRIPVAMSADVPILDRPLPYAPPLTLQQAKAVMQAAEAEALAHEWPVAIVLADADIAQDQS